jgi:hypothetical protein
VRYLGDSFSIDRHEVCVCPAAYDPCHMDDATAAAHQSCKGGVIGDVTGYRFQRRVADRQPCPVHEGAHVTARGKQPRHDRLSDKPRCPGDRDRVCHAL